MRNNLRIVPVLNFSWAFLLIQSVIVPYFSNIGLTMSEILLIQSIFSITLCVLDIPMGYLCDHLGRRETLILSALFKAAGGVALVSARGFWQVGVAYGLIGVANSLFSGTDVALLYESIEDVRASGVSAVPGVKEVFGIRIRSIQAGTLLSALVGAGIAQFSLHRAVVLNSVFAFAPILICLFIKNPVRRTDPQKGHLENFRTIFSSVFRRDARVRLIAMNLMIYSAPPMLALYAFQGWWNLNRVPLVWFGIFIGISNLFGLAIGHFTPRFFSERFGPWALWSVGIIPVVGFWVCPWVPVGLSVLFYALFEVSRSLTQILISAQLNQSIDTRFRATVNSMVSFGTRAIVILCGPLFGRIIDRVGFKLGFLALGALFFLAFVLAFIPFHRRSRSGFLKEVSHHGA